MSDFEVKSYLGDYPFFGEEEDKPLFPIEIDGVIYEEEDAHIFVANSNAVNLPIPDGTSPIFVAVDGVKKKYETEVRGKVFDDSTIHAIFDWENNTKARQNWFSDILQFGLYSDGKRNQLKSARYAFYGMETNPAIIPTLDISNLTNMIGMFQISSFNQNISGWDTSSVTTMMGMFSYATSFNQDISQWDTSNVTDMGGMFNGAFDFNSDISGWDTSKVESMDSMFYNATSFTSDISGWNTSKVTYMLSMFYNATSFNQDISQWNTSNVTDMSGMFREAYSFNQDLSQWCVSKIGRKPDGFDSGSGFEDQPAKQPDWGSCPRGEDVPIPDDYSIEDCHIFVANENNVYLSIPNGTNPIFVSVDKEKKNYYEVKGKPFNGSTIHAIFDWDNSIGNATQQNWISNILQLGSRSVGDEPEGYENPPALPSGRIPNQLKSGKSAFYRMKANPAVISNLDVSNVTDMMRMFYESNFNSNISKWDTSKVTTMYYMFYEATAFNQDISKWDTSNVEDMGYMFNGAIKFNKDISGWDTSNVEIMRGMFQKATDFNQDISKWNTSNVNNMIGMFMDAKSFNQPLSDWDTSNVTSMASMFRSATNFNSDISKWDTSNVTSMYYMFGGFNFNQPISEWNTSNVEDMSYMFSYNREFNQDISKWNTSKVTNMKQMFDRAFVFTSDISKWDTSKVEDMTKMFYQAGQFNADLSQWCVSKIPYAPERFDEQTFAWTLPKPVWGTCPRFENIFPITGNDGKEYELADCHIFKANGNAVGLPIPNGTTPTFVAVDGVKKDYASEVKGQVFDGKTIHAIFDWGALHADRIYQDWYSDILQIGLNSVTGKRNQLKSGAVAFCFMEANPAAISTLDVSNLTSMEDMFNGATSLNQDISQWDTSKVTNMGGMFFEATDFNSDISGWNTSNVTNMRYTFSYTDSFNQDLSQWCVSLINYRPTDFDYRANAWTLPNSRPVWGTCPRGENIPNIDDILPDPYVTEDCHVFVGKGMVYFPVANDADVKFVAVDGVEMDYDTEVKGNIFDGSTIHAIFDWDNSNERWQSWFSDILQFGLNSVTGKRNQLKNGNRAFFGMEANPAAIANLDISNLTDMSLMFYDQEIGYSTFNQDISHWDTSKVTNMEQMFVGAVLFNQDISGWDTSKVMNMRGMFEWAEIFYQDLSQWCVSLIDSKPDGFDLMAGFMGQTAKQPQWGKCPGG